MHKTFNNKEYKFKSAYIRIERSIDEKLLGERQLIKIDSSRHFVENRLINERKDTSRNEKYLSRGGNGTDLIDAITIDHIDESVVISGRREVDEFAAPIGIDDRNDSGLAQNSNVLEVIVVFESTHRDRHYRSHMAV